MKRKKHQNEAKKELADSALLGYLRRGRKATTVQEGTNLSFYAKRKKTVTHNWVTVFLAEKERFGLY